MTEDSPPMTETQHIDYNRDYLHLSVRQQEIHNVFMKSNMNTYPQSLIWYISMQSKIYGICGDCISCWVADWIAERELEELKR